MSRPVLELEQLRLRYPGNDHWTLDGLDLTLRLAKPWPWLAPQAAAKAPWPVLSCSCCPPGAAVKGGCG